MITHDIEQGTPEWHEFRQKHFNASEAAAMLGISPYMTRDELLKKKVFGIEKEHGEYTKKLFAEGHRLEQEARLEAEDEARMELFPAVGSDGKLAASFDGISMDGMTIWEHKTINADLRKVDISMPIKTMPDYYMAQVQHQMLVAGAAECLFVASNDQERKSFWIMSDEAWEDRIIKGWNQFEKDMETYKLEEVKPEVTGTAPEQLPALFIELTGKVTASNLKEFRSHALNVIGSINTDLQTDEDFASADKTAKWCKDVEARLDAAKQHALSQTQSIDELFKALDDVREEARQKRLSLEKLVKERKGYLKSQIIRDVQDRFVTSIITWSLDFMIEVKDEYGKEIIRRIIDKFSPDFLTCTKGLKTLDSISRAVESARSDEFSKATGILIFSSDMLQWFHKSGYSDYGNTLFRDMADLLFKHAGNEETFLAVAKSRIEEHKKLITAQEEKTRLAKEQEIKTDVLQVKQEEKTKQEFVSQVTAEQIDHPVDVFLSDYYQDETQEYRFILIEFYDFLKEYNHVK